MADITTRAGKGSPLTNNEVDANFTNLNTDKAENGANSDITSLSGITGGISAADYVDFDVLASAVSRATGRLTWNSSDGCLEVGLIGSDVTQQIGQEMLARVYNADTSTISNGEVVYFHSTAGEIIAAKKYIANGTIDPHLIVGLATEDIAAGAYGYVTEFGFVRSLDTAAYNPGDILFASPSTAGAIQSNEPSTPNDVVRVGICLESDSTNGIVLVNPHDVPRADEIRYDNADSDLTATNVKSAIDELDLVKADIDLLTSNVTFYLTNANDATLTGYKQLVTSTLDTNYDEVAVDYLASGITATAGLIQAWVSDVNVLVGDIAGIVVPIVFNVRKDTGSGDARFYIEVYIRDSLGVETLITTTNVSDYVTSTIYAQLSLSATISLQTFTDTDQVVLKLYGQTGSNTADYEFQLGGASPFRSLFPVPVSVVPSVANAYAIVADTTNFDDKLSSADDTVQKALETLDDHVHQASEITGLTASNTDTNTAQFNGHLSAADDDVQKALNTLDEITLDEVAAQNGTTTQNITINAQLNVDNLRLDGNAITSTDTDGNIALTPNGTGEVDISKVDIDSGAIDGTTIGGATPGAGTFTDLTVNTTATFAGATIADLGTVTTANIDGGTIDGVTLDATIADIDNIRIDGNSITSTNGNGDISITPNGLGEVNISKVDIDAGEIDGTTIGATSAAAGNFTTLDVSTSASFAGASIDDLGAVATADINGGTIDGADITVGAGKTLSVINGTLTLADNQISGDKVHGGIISNFASTGIDDNASSTAITISSAGATTFSGNVILSEASPRLDFTDTDEADSLVNFSMAGSTMYVRARGGTSSHGDIRFQRNDNGSTHLNVFRTTAGGDVLFYDDDGSTEGMRWDSSVSKVGIGISSPAKTIDMQSTAPSVRFRNTSATTTITDLLTTGTNGHLFNMVLDAGNAGTSPSFLIKNYTTEIFRFTGTGRLGIGEPSPDEELHIKASVPTIKLEDGDGTNQFVRIFENNGQASVVARNNTSFGNTLFRRENGTNTYSILDLTADGDVDFYDNVGSNIGMRWDASAERLGIGATIPTSLLQLGGTAENADAYITFGKRVASTETNFPFIGHDDPDGGGHNDLGIGVRSTNGTINFYTGNAAAFNSSNRRMTITASGNVLIGRTSETLGGGVGDNLQIGSGGGGAGLTIHSATNSNGDIQFADGTTGSASYRGLIRYLHAQDALDFWTAGTQRIRIDSDGETSFFGGGVSLAKIGNIGPASNSAIRISRTDSTVVNGNPLGYLEFGSNDATGGTDTAFAYVSAEAEGTFGAGDNPTALTFGVTPDGSGTVAEAMRITNAGELQINSGVIDNSAEHSFTINGTEELRITNTETSVFGTSGDLFQLVDTNLTASASNIGNVRIAFDDSAGTRVAYVGTANSSDFFVNNQYGSTKLTYAGSTKLTTINEGINVTGSIGVGKTPTKELEIQLDSTSATTLGQKGGLQFYAPSSTVGNGGEITWSSQSGNTETWCAISGHILTNSATGSTGELVFATKGDQADTAPTERMRINSSGNVGIGEPSPSDGKLQISAGATAGVFVRDSSNSGAAPYIRVQGRRQDANGSESFSGGLVLEHYRTDASVNNNKALGTIYFGGNHTNSSESNIAYGASIVGKAEGAFNSASDMPTGLAFFTGSTGRALGTANVDFGDERMRISSAGYIGINEQNPARHLHVNSGATQVTSIFESTGTSSYIDFANSTTAQGRSRIGAEGTDTLVFKTEGAERLRILAGGGLTFNGDTATANALDDYEEGTYPVRLYDAASGGNQSTNSVTGYYTKIGRVVTVNIYAFNNIGTSAMTSSNVVYFNLPLASGSNGRHVGSVNHHGFTYAGNTNYQSMMPQVTQNASRGYFVANGYGVGDASVKVSDIGSGADDIVTMSITYHV